MLKKIANVMTSNVTWKILSLLIAFFFWWAVVSYEDPVKEVRFDNISVTKLNEESVTGKNYAIDYLEGETVQVVIRAKRSVADRLNKNDITVEADISNLSITNAIDIVPRVDADIQSISVYPANLKVSIENVITVTKEVQYIFEGETAEDYIVLDPVITPSVIQVTGPESQVALISSVLVPIPIDNAKKDITLFFKPKILDSNNEAVTKVTTNISEVAVSVPVQFTKDVPVRFVAFDQVPEGYRLMGTNLSQTMVRLRGPEEALDPLNLIIINDVSLAEIREDTTESAYLPDYLPAQVHVLGFDRNIRLTFIVEEILEKTVEVPYSAIDVRNIPEDLVFVFDTEGELFVTARGIAADLEDVTVEGLSPYIRLLNLEPGTHEVNLNYYVPYGVEVVGADQIVTVTLSQAPEIEEETEEETSGN